MALRLLHFADTHIGVESYGRIDPSSGLHSRLLDFRDALERAVDIGLEQQVDAALFAGDAYRTCLPSPTHQRIFAAAVNRLADAGVPVVMVTGNHDLPVAFGRAHALDIFSVLVRDRVVVAGRPGIQRVATRNGELQVACLPWPNRSFLRNTEEARGLSERELRETLEGLCRGAIEQMAEDLDPAVPAVLLAHISAEGAVFSGSERTALTSGDPTLSVAVLANPAFDYVALGHVHRFQDVNAQRRPPVVYSGSTERIDFGEAADRKGVCIVTIPDGPTPADRATAYDHLALPARRFVAISVDIGADADPTEALLAAIGERSVADAVVRVRYTCSDEQYDAIDFGKVREALRAAHLVAGVIRDRPPDERRPRVEVTEHLDVMQALDRYLDTRPDLEPLREPLVAAGRELHDELMAEDLGREGTEQA